MIDAGFAEGRERGDVVQVRSGVEDIVVQRDLVGRSELLRQVVVAHRVREPPCRMLHVGVDEAVNRLSPITRVLDGWRGRVGRNCGGGEIYQRESGEQRETATAIQNGG